MDLEVSVRAGALARRLVQAFVLIAAALCLFPAEARADVTFLEVSTDGGATYSETQVSYCGERTVDFEVAYSYCGFDPPCNAATCGPSAFIFSANPYRMTATLYHNGVPIATQGPNQSCNAWWRFFFYSIPLQAGTYTAVVKLERRNFYGAWVTNDTSTSGPIPVVNTANYCPIGWFDGANCQMGTAPPGSQGFVWMGELYYNALVTPNDCPLSCGGWDGAHCYVPHPAGTTPFIFANNLYYTPAPSGPLCPLPCSTFDGANCLVNTPPGSAHFLWMGNLYYYMPSCPVPGSSWDGAHCEMPNVPAGATPFVWQNVNLDYTPLCCPTCMHRPLACGDGVQNEGETGVDCGGGACDPCRPGERCTGPADCVGGVCKDGVCQVSCANRLKDGDETDVDCGGSCASCGPGQGCKGPSDCRSGACVNGVCQASSCFDGVQDGDETGVDCGGSCVPCSCSDGVQDGDETDIDCGGSCDGCPPGAGCDAPDDCGSLVCRGSVCQEATCSDGVKNGGETDVDCGGDDCARCGAGRGCALSTDCLDGVCTSNACQGVCLGSTAACAASDECHVAGACDASTGVCSNPPAPDGTPCTGGGDACTQPGACQAGACVGATPTICAASDPCHLAGDCDASTGVCSNPAAPDGAPPGGGAACDLGLSGACAKGTTACAGGVLVCRKSPQCGAGQGCKVGSDCPSGLCAQGICQPVPAGQCSSTCWNVGADCGDAAGASLDACILAAADDLLGIGECQSAYLAATSLCNATAAVCERSCQPASCSNGVQDEAETGVDCGGPCSPCSTCSDGAKGGGETGVDCGGPCPPCPLGNPCSVDADCQSGGCLLNTCVATVCTAFRRDLGSDVADAMISAADGTASYGGLGFLGEGTSHGSASSALIRFGVASIPQGAVITSAKVELHETSSTQQGAAIHAHAVTAPWSETTVTYASFAGAFDPSAAGTFAGGTGTSADTFGLATDLVQAWVSGTRENDGILLESAPATGHTLWSSSEAGPGVGPELDICYLLP